MKIVLLSGGSGQRLWPLSNDSCSKQYIKFIQRDPNAHKVGVSDNCSMLQRVYEQLEAVGLAKEVVIVASEAQKELIVSQLPEDKIKMALEPMRRDTFPAVMLAVSFLYNSCKISENEAIVVLPVDPYVTLDYFKKIMDLAYIVEQHSESVGLLGAKPSYPAEKYGYILKGENKGVFWNVAGFVEKPSIQIAQELIRDGSLWNCGVFCFTLQTARLWMEKYNLPLEYDILVENYAKLPCRSFDYEVLEKWNKIVTVVYDDMWKDIGTWNTFTEEMAQPIIGQAILDGACKNCHVVNTLDIPMIVMGGQDMVIAASHDGILIADKERSSYLKDCLKQIELVSRYEERRWGTIKTLDRKEEENASVCTNKVKVESGQYTTYHYHLRHKELITILNGEGEIVIGKNKVKLVPGITMEIKEGEKHAIRAVDKLQYIEILLGDLSGDDVVREIYEWDLIIDMIE